MTQTDPALGPKAQPVGGPITDRPSLWWLNWATVRGAALVVAGVVVIASPERERMVSTVAAFLLIFWAVGELWNAVITPRTDRDTTGLDQGAGLPRRVTRAVVAIGFVSAAVLLLFDRASANVVLGGVFVLQGVSLVLLALISSDTPGGRRNHLVSGLVLVTLGGLTVLVPETAILALRAGLGVGSLALGGVLLSMGLRRGAAGIRIRLDRRSAPALVNDWLLRRRLDPDGRAELVDSLFFEHPKKVAKLASFWVMMVLATGIATFALIQDSTAVVIGAMLVAPLMTPIMGVSAAAVNGWAVRLGRSLTLVLVAALAAVAVAWLIAAWLPTVGDISANSQISSRIEPSLLDFCIAILAGAAGAYATVDPRVSSSLSGVAIAVALVPPLSVVGITLQQGAWEDAVGASLLFLTNFVSIVLAAVTVFVLMGFALLPPNEDQRSRLTRVVGVFAAGAFLILIPLSFTSQDLWNEASDEAEASEAVLAWLPEDGDVELVRVEAEGETLEIVLSGPKLPGDTESLQADLEQRLGYRPEATLRMVTSEIKELD